MQASGQASDPPVDAGPSRIAVVGATSGVGQHVVQLLSEGFYSPSPSLAVRVVSRSQQKAKQIYDKLESAVQLEYASADVTDDSPEGRSSLKAALAGCDTILICTGTTAFPTKRWLNKPPKGNPLATGLALFSGELKVTNSPQTVDNEGVRNILAALDEEVTKKVVLLSSIGTRRPEQFPFPILNIFGVLDEKRRGENYVIRDALAKGYKYCIVRPGRLIGAPHTNPGMLQSEPAEDMFGVQLARGDRVAGDATRKTTAQSLVAAVLLSGDIVDNIDFSLISAPGREEDGIDWSDEFRRMTLPLRVKNFEFDEVNKDQLTTWVRQWAGSVVSSGALFPPLPLSVRVDFPEDKIATMAFLNVSTDGAIDEVGRLEISLQEKDSKTNLMVLRYPAGVVKPFLGEVQLMDKLAEDIAEVVSGA